MTKEAIPAGDPSSVAGAWSVVPSALWILLILIAIFLFRNEIRDIFQHLSWRLRTGSAVKLFSIELGQSYVSPSIDGNNESALQSYADESAEWWRQREGYYAPNRNVHVVHRVEPSKRRGMLYDIQIYVIPHTGKQTSGTLSSVDKVEYYFGRHWGNRVFVSVDRSRGFPITTSAYGTFMCLAKLHFTDGKTVFVSRYVDFEMGSIGSKA